MSPIQKIRKNKSKLVSFLVFFLMFFSVFLTISFIEPEHGIAGAWADNGYSYSKKIIINSSQVVSSLSNFPVLIHIVDDSDLYSGCSNDSGYDIVFYDSTNSTKFAHEIEYWNWDTGNSQVDADIWVNVTSVSGTSDTVIWMYYGNNSVTSSQENPSGVWDSHYLLVYHCDEASGNLIDSTSNNNNATLHGSATYHDTGIVGYGINLSNDGSDPENGFIYPDLGIYDGNADFTWECWATCSFAGGGRTGYIITGVGEGRVVSHFHETSNIYFQYRDTGGTWHDLYYGYSANTWYHVGMSYAGSGDRDLIINGVNRDSDTDSSNFESSTYDNTIGYSGYGGSDSSGLDGIIDEIRISDTKRSDAYLITSYNNMVNQTSFISFGNQNNNVQTSVSLILNNNKFTHSGQLGNTSLSNQTGTTFEWAEFNISYNGQNIEYIRINITDVNATYIKSSNCSYQFSSDNTTWGGLSGNWKSGGDGGFTIILNSSTWTTANGCYGTNPFPISGNTSIWMVEKITIPGGIPIQTYSTTTGTSRTWDAGYYT